MPEPVAEPTTKPDEPVESSAPEPASVSAEPAPVFEMPEPPSVDLSGYDMAIAEARKNLEMVDQDQIGQVETRIRNLEADRAKAQADGQSTMLEFYKEQMFKNQFANVAPDVDLEKDIPASLPVEEKFKLAKTMQSKINAVKSASQSTESEKQKEIQDAAMAEARKMAGDPLVPEPGAPDSEQMETLNKAMKERRLDMVGQNAGMKRFWKDMAAKLRKD